MSNNLKLTSLLLGLYVSHAVAADPQNPNSEVDSFTLPIQTSSARLPAEKINRESPVAFIFESLKSEVPDDNRLPAQPTVDGYGRPMQAGINESGNSFSDSLRASYKPVQDYELKPGDNIAVAVAAGLMNRIKTNFSMVAIRTSDDQSIIEASDGYIYITTNSMAPVGIMVYEEGLPETAISLVLQPDNNPPAMINVDVKLSTSQKYKIAQRKRERARQEKIDSLASVTQEDLGLESHVSRMKALLLPIAQNNIPTGFTESIEIPRTLSQPCSVAIRQKTAQRYVGSREYIDVVVLYNQTDYAYQIKEEQCLSRDALAVAFVDQAILQPYESTEVYIVRDKLYVEKLEKSNRRRQISAAELGLTGGE
ncbi:MULTISPECIES: type-F conjugative transfer system secretin TraK [Shewanella]|uniref:TraK domain-containing protein n=1 Tax=Shewanella TaxID=22 RepID=UPI000B343718|nr:type-F conjugative transfer system secretin TraK [Shewanella putrefaciens]